jgi:hypothetical protein
MTDEGGTIDEGADAGVSIDAGGMTDEGGAMLILGPEKVSPVVYSGTFTVLFWPDAISYI